MSEFVFKLSRVPGAPISDEELIADLRCVAESLGTERVTQDQYRQHGKYNKSTQKSRFGGWNNALLKAGLRICTTVSDEELIEDLHLIAESLKTDHITIDQYEQYGKYCADTLIDRFGNWNKAHLRAGLMTNKISDIKLFENILVLWQHYGHQPTVNELAFPPSLIFSVKPYYRRFGSWMNALEAFVEYANGTDTEVTKGTIEEVTETQITNVTENVIVENTERSKKKPIVNKRGPRHPGRMLIMQVLIRDKGICQLCKRAATADNLNYHIDHIFPWIKGGPTILSNLQLLCSRCNLIKGDLDLTNCIESST